MTIDTQNNHYSFNEYLEFCKWHLNTEILVIPFGTADSDYSSGAYLPTPLADMKFVVRFFFPAKDKRFNQQPFSTDFYQSVSESLAKPIEEVERYEVDPDDNVIKYNPFSEDLLARVNAHFYGAHSEEFELHCESAYKHLVQTGEIDQCERFIDLPAQKPQFRIVTGSEKSSEPRAFICSSLDPRSIQIQTVTQ